MEVRSNVLAGVNQNKILEGVEKMRDKEANWKNPFGDGKAGNMILKILKLLQNKF